MSDVRRYSAYHSGDPHKIGLWADPDGYWLPFTDHARIVAEMEQAHAAALAEAQGHSKELHGLVLMLLDQMHGRAIIDLAQQQEHDPERVLTWWRDERKFLHVIIEGGERAEAIAAAAPRTLTADEWEQIAKQFRIAYQLGACDPSNCPECDCDMDDEGRQQLAGMALSQAQAVIRLIHDSGKEEN